MLNCFKSHFISPTFSPSCISGYYKSCTVLFLSKSSILHLFLFHRGKFIPVYWSLFKSWFYHPTLCWMLLALCRFLIHCIMSSNVYMINTTKNPQEESPMWHFPSDLSSDHVVLLSVYPLSIFVQPIVNPVSRKQTHRDSTWKLPLSNIFQKSRYSLLGYLLICQSKKSQR